MKIILKSLSIINFKGISNLSLSFNNKENFILGANGAGKTTISDAYHWLMIGKDSSDAKEFEIKPIDKEGNRAQRLDNSVEGVIEVDGIEITLKKVHSEKWQKPKGQPEAEFKGNETTYFWNGAPITMKEYQAKLAEIINESRLKLCSNVSYFNSLNWTDRRAVLIDMAGGIDTDAILHSDPNYAFIIAFLGQKKSFKEFKAQIANDKKRAKEELAGIPHRVEEVKRSNASLERPFERLKGELAKQKSELANIDKMLDDKTEAYRQEDLKIGELRKKKQRLETDVTNIENALRVSILAKVNVPDEKLTTLQQSLGTDKNTLSEVQKDLNFLNERTKSGNIKIDEVGKEIASLNEEIAKYRTEWSEENKKKISFDENDSICPTCKRAFEESDIFAKQQDMISAFNSNKKLLLDSIVSKSDVAKDKIKARNAEIERYKSELSDISNKTIIASDSIKSIQACITETEAAIQAHISSPKELSVSPEMQFAEALEGNLEYNDLVSKIKEVILEIDDFKPIDNSELITRKKELQESIDEINKDLLNETVIKNNVSRVKELQSEESVLAQRIADLEMQEYHMQQFSFKQMDEVEKTVNKMFKYVTFQMFNKQVNGEIIEACETLVNGKPIHGGAVNTAATINAGVDIINALSNHYNTHVPMFIDGRESVTDLIYTDTQNINLIVSPSHKKLTVSNKVASGTAA